MFPVTDLKMHIDDEPEATERGIYSRVSSFVPLKLLLGVIELEGNAADSTSSVLLSLAEWILRKCTPLSSPMNVYYFLHSALELLFDLVVRRSHPCAPGSVDEPAIDLHKVEWLQRAISYISSLNLHLHNVTISFAVKHLCCPGAASSLLERHHHRRRRILSLQLEENEEHESNGLPSAPKRQAILQNGVSSARRHSILPQIDSLPEVAQCCFLQLIVSCLSLGACTDSTDNVRDSLCLSLICLLLSLVFR